MKKENVIQEKSFAFAIRIVKVYQYLWMTNKPKVCLLMPKNYAKS